MPLNHISCHWMIDAMSLDQTSIFFMSLDRMSFYRTIFFMSLERTSCHWIGLHAIESNFMPLDRKRYSIGPAAYRINLFPRVLFQIHNGKYGGSSSGSTSNSTELIENNIKTVLLDVMNQLASSADLGYGLYKVEWLCSVVLRLRGTFDLLEL